LPTLRTSPRGERNAGFTLVEALVATALMATILAALATITAQWLPNWNRGLGRVQRSEHLALGLERLVSDLAAAEYIPIDRNTVLPLFDGADRSITFVRTALGPNTPPGLEAVRIAQIEDGGTPVVVRTRRPFAPGGQASSRPITFSDPVVLVRGPYQVSFAYAGRDRIWRSSWQEQIRLPRAIKVSLSDVADRRIDIASTATLLHAEAPAQCVHSKTFTDCFAPPRDSNQSAEGDKPGGLDRGKAQ
jgi:general secretion pathway protein J